MIIRRVEITNATEPTSDWWDQVASKPTEQLIEAVLTVTISWRDYNKLLANSVAVQRGEVAHPTGKP